MAYIKKEYILNALATFNDRENGNSHFLNGIDTAKEITENAPTADVAEVKHGEWKPRTGIYYDYYCSNCNGDAIEYESSYGSVEYYLTDYCPNCGAKMDGNKK